jgi:hypothetical protein
MTEMNLHYMSGFIAYLLWAQCIYIRKGNWLMQLLCVSRIVWNTYILIDANRVLPWTGMEQKFVV